MTSSPLWRHPEPLVLASGSATRRALLETAGIPVDVHPAAIDERALEEPLRRKGAAPQAIARHLAAAKAMAVSGEHPGRLVLGADQTLDFSGELFTKPADLVRARQQIERLSGRSHSLHSAWALAIDGALVAEGEAEARLTMRSLSSTFLDAYVAAEGGALLSSVGAYRLEGLGIHLFETIEGDQTTILGLPLLSLLPALRHRGAVI